MIPRDEIIRMAREAGLHLPYWVDDEDPEKDQPRWTMVSPLPHLLERFAALVEARATVAEREACKQAADEQWVKGPCISGGDAIRARSAG